MKLKTQLLKSASLLAAGFLLTAGLAQAADHNDRHDNDRHDNDRHDDRDHDRDRHRRNEINYHFEDRSRVVVRNYYEQQYRRGRCPPGLSRKYDNCIMPGHVRNWRVGERLPRNVVYYDLPPSVVVEMGPPPRGSRYVRVGSDILLLALGTGLIIDAIDDLDRR